MADVDLKESILLSVKKMIGPSEDYDYFDPDLIMHINSVFNILQQMGLGSSSGFAITGSEETWEDFKNLSGVSDNIIEMVKSYMYLKVRMQFDPPTGSVGTTFEEQIKEYEWRLSVALETEWS